MNESYTTTLPDQSMEQYVSIPICPMITRSDCLPAYCKPTCAWFDEDRNQCAILTIAKAEAKRK